VALLAPLPSTAGPSKAEEAKVTQLVDRVEYRGEKLQAVLEGLRGMLKTPPSTANATGVNY
jgi:hypothetical protein